MPPIKTIGDQKKLVPTKDFPKYADFTKYENFNPVQSRVFEIFHEDVNILISATTAAGKTVCAEMFAAYEARKRGGKVVYLAPMKALAREKIDDWTDPKHHFHDLKLVICTGDYRLTEERQEELASADVLIMTTEMFNSRVRSWKSEKNNFLKDIGTLIIDEQHLLSVPGRGDHLEVGLMKFCKINSKARIVGLSATIPNAEEIAEWMSYVLNQKETYLLKSDYRPCPLGIHFETYERQWKYDANEEAKIDKTVEIVTDHPDDKFLLFVHTKNTGHKLKKALEREGFKPEFHNADLDKEARHKLEDRFKKDNKFQILIATSTVAWGCNSPARRVVIVGMHRGLTEVEPYDIWQMVGRSGRPGFDPRGDAYILLPHDKEYEYMRKLKGDYKVKSQLLDYVGSEQDPHYKCLAFHLVSEIHHGEIKNIDDVHEWYERSLAHFQLSDTEDIERVADATIKLLLNKGAIREENGRFKATSVGKISSMFYYSPFDVADLKNSFDKLFDMEAQDNDLAISMALGDVDTIRCGIVSKDEANTMSRYENQSRAIEKLFGKKFMPTAVKGGFCYYTLLKGNSPGIFGGVTRGLQFDFERTISVLYALDSMACKWGQKTWMDKLNKRIRHGVEPHLLPFCEIPNIGKMRAEKLYKAGYKSLSSIAGDIEGVQSVLKMSRAQIEEIVNQAKLLSMMQV
jgi:replicative superfamily II helicase